MIRFDGISRSSSSHDRQRRPPNYLSSRFQLRILTLVAALIVVILLMHQARRPANWRWLWAFDQKSKQSDAVRGAPHGPPHKSSQPPSPGAAPGAQPAAKAAGRDQDGRTLNPPADDSTPVAMHRLWRDGWKRIRARLTASDRNLLRHVMFDARHGTPLAAEQRKSWTALVESVVQNWHMYVKQLLATTATDASPLNPKQKTRLRHVAAQCLKTVDSLLPVLLRAADPTRMTPADRQQLDMLQALFDEIDWQRVTDNTPLWRSAEYDAWYRAWEQLDDVSPAQLRAAAQKVTYTQLFAQPKDYRGQRVTFRGAVRNAYRAEASTNPVGIQYYYVMSVQLQPTAAETVRVYCRSVPKGFPEIRWADASQSVTQLDVPVEIVGFFFKRAVYPANDGLHLCPVVLGEIIRYVPSKQPESPPAGPNLRDLLFISLAAAVFGIIFSIWVYRRTSRPNVRHTQS